MAIADRILEMTGDRAEAMVTVAHGVESLTRFANSTIHQNVEEEGCSVLVKAVTEGRSAGASTTRTDDDGLRGLVDRVVEAARVRPPDPYWPGLAPPAPVALAEHYDERTAAATPADRAEVVRAFVEAGEGLEAAGYCSTEAVTVAFANSAGQRAQARHSAATIDGIHRRDGSDGTAQQTSRSLRDLDGGAAGRLAAGKAQAGRDAADAEPGSYEVVLEPTCLANMLQFLAYAGFNAKPFSEGTSFVHLGEQQFDPTVRIWDDALDERTLGLPFDSEGTPKRRVELVREGVTLSLVHDRRTAGQAGTKSTGHASGSESFGALPANLFFGHGEGSPEELIASVERGLLVSDFWYTRILDPKTQVVTGLTRNGLFRIESGRIAGAVRNLRFTQSFVAGLGPGHVLGIGNDGRLVGRMHVPTVRLASWNFTGGAKG